MVRIYSVVAVLLLLCCAIAVACGGGTPEETNTAYNEPQPEPEPPPPDPAPPEPVAPPPPPPPPPEPPVITAEQAWEGLTPAPPAAWLTCTADADCQAVEVGCCDHCNGGRVVSVVSKQAKAAQKRYRPRRCPDACTELGCAEAVPVCIQGPQASDQPPASKCGHKAMWMVPSAGGEAAPAAPAPAPAPAQAQ
jgi:protein TonB